MQDLIDLKSTGNKTSDSVAPSTSQYPWGLSITLENETISALGLDPEMFSAGDNIQIMGEAKVESIEESEREGSKTSCVRLQITKLAKPKRVMFDRGKEARDYMRTKRGNR
jgi:hypothetical protein